MRLRPASLVLICSFLVPALHAQVQRTFVSSTGSDANPCSRSAPCRNFAAAVAATLDGGEVIVLDSAGYGPVTITTSVSLIAPAGVYAGITAFTGDAVTINAPANGTVVLRGLTLNGVGGANGVTANTFGDLHVESCVIARFTNRGLQALGSGAVFIDDTIARDNTNSGFVIYPQSGTATGSIDRSRSERNFNGFVAASVSPGTTVTVHDSVAAACAGVGFYAPGGGLTVKSCVSANNGTGVYSSTLTTQAGTAVVSDSMIGDNTIGFRADAGDTLESYGNNQLSHNGTATAGTITPVTPQ